MQITHAEVTTVPLKLRQPVHMAGLPPIKNVTAFYVRLETNQGRNAWGCGVAEKHLTGELPAAALRALTEAAAKAPDLHPTNIAYSLAELSNLVMDSPAATCAFDLAFHDLLGLVTGMPLFRLLGGYRNRIQTSATVPLSSVEESVEMAEMRARHGFSILKVKGGLDAELDVRRVKAIHRALPYHTLRLDADGAYSVQQALEVARALKKELEMIEQPTPAEDFAALREVTRNSPVDVLADQSVSGPASALELAATHSAHALSIKMATCGGLQCARQMDAIAKAAQMATMVGCVIEPALLIAAGLTFALSSQNVRYGDLDGNLDLMDDPTTPGFNLQDGWLVASEIPGLGCTVNLS